ncbi:MAG: acyl-CoA synthetase FdrA [Deltaproteobacteria bacterium]|nr:acyl-CoA synthetase FdrA [Deltaproteobacteria bacterium]
MIRTAVKRNSYLDSIFLMNAAKEIMKIKGVKDAILLMGTDMNKTVLKEVGGLTPEAMAAAPNDLILSLDLEDGNIAKDVLAFLESLIAGKEKNQHEEETVFPSLNKAIDASPDANLVFISVPGEFAAQEAKTALNRGLNAFIFSDNVPIEDEVELKKMALEKGLLVMGPGCGTSVINHVSIGMMSTINEGSIGIVGASGSGIHQIATLIDRQGLGISQAIGTGGRDLSKEVDGITMIQGIHFLEKDQNTKVIVLVSKPPAPAPAEKIFDLVRKSAKPVVIFFLGGDQQQIKAVGAHGALTLEEAAMKAIKLANNEAIPPENFIEACKTRLAPLAAEEKGKLFPGQRYLRGLFCGGTHSEEAILLLQDMIGSLYANVSFGNCRKVANPHSSIKNTLIDMGDEEFTKGKPHPVIDPSILKDRLWKEGSDPEVAVILFDLLLGYGAHRDPVGTIEETLAAIRRKAHEEGRHVSIVASICGSTRDPQGFEEQKTRLEALGVKVLPSTAQAAILSGLIIS